MAKLTLQDKVDLYENTLKRIAAINAEAVELEALGSAPDALYKFPFALGWLRGALKSVAQDAYWTLNQGAKR